MATINKYDKEGRIKVVYSEEFKILWKYQYTNEHRIVTVTSPKNRTNYKTVIKEKIGLKKNIYIEKKEFGETYDIRTFYNERGEEIKIERINKLKTTKVTTKIIRTKKGKAVFWLEDLNNGYKNILFTIPRSKVKKLKDLLK